MKEKINALTDRRKGLLTQESADRQHARGRLTADERIALLLDDNSFTEIGAFATSQSHEYSLDKKRKDRDGVVTGCGTVAGRKVFVYAQDFTFMGGSMGEMHTRKVAHIIELAMNTGAPVIGLLDSGGARIQEGIDGLDGGGAIFRLNTLASGAVPQLSVILGPCAGIAVYSPALTDFIAMSKDVATMFITGPNVIRNVTGEQIDADKLGGADVHAAKSGVAHFVGKDERETLATIRQLLSYLPANCDEEPPYVATEDDPRRESPELATVVPDHPMQVYNVKKVLKEILDRGSFFEVHERFARNAVVGFGRLDGHVVGFVANQPMVLAGCIDIDAADKIARFVNFCDAFNIPLLNAVDVTGFLPGSKLEHAGIIRHGAKVLFAYSQATVPKVALVLRKAYGGAYIALVSRDMGYDKVIAWPTAEIAVMGAEGAVGIVNRKEIKDPEHGEENRKRLIQEYRDKLLNPYVAASRNRVDMVIEPAHTRRTLIATFAMLRGKKQNPPRAKKHGSTPL